MSHGWAGKKAVHGKCSKQNVQRLTNYPSTLRSNVTVDVVNPRTLRWAMLVGIEMLLGRSEHGLFVKAPQLSIQ